MADEIVLTPAGRDKLKAELEHLRTVEMPMLSERIRQARALGDLSENFDYQDAKRQQGFVAGRMKDIELMLENGRIVEETGPGADAAGMGSTVTLRDLDYDDEFSLTLVGMSDADPANDRISVSSPIGKAVMERKVGDQVTVETPEGTSRFEIISIK
ncbi:MAG: transcription elongation factor GreA [Armatimonadaceae bacterium]